MNRRTFIKLAATVLASSPFMPKQKPIDDGKWFYTVAWREPATIEHVGVWHRVLTAEEKIARYKGENLPSLRDGLLAWWEIDEHGSWIDLADKR